MTLAELMNTCGEVVAPRARPEGAHRGRGEHLRSEPGVPPCEHTLFFEGSKVLTFPSLSIFGRGLSTFKIGLAAAPAGCGTGAEGGRAIVTFATKMGARVVDDRRR